MASNVSVTSTAVNGGIKCCKLSIDELNKANRTLNREYQQAGADGWNDSKYRDLGGIIGDCCTALGKPIKDLEDCIVKLTSLLKAVEIYESTNMK